MRVDDRVSIKRISEPTEEEIPKSEILLNGVPSGRRISGAVLEGAVQLDSFHLIFMTDDVPFEDQLTIVLLDRELNELDTARIGGPYTTGSFSSLTLIEPDKIQFRFIGDTVWSVRVLPQPQFRVPFVSEPRGVHRGFGFSRHFVVCGDPKPDAL